MLNDDVVKCPLCGGFTRVEKPELLAALNDSNIRLQIENYVAKLLGSPSGAFAGVTAGQPGSDFNKEVHNWNPSVPGWRRSPKE